MVASYLSQALLKAQRVKQDYEFKSYAMDADRETIRRHGIEMQKKFTLSFACLIFFFIGAPLGAIIRKGGAGNPAGDFGDTVYHLLYHRQHWLQNGP